jgi:plastocyanin
LPRRTAVIAILAALAGCGGGGDAGPTFAPNAAAPTPAEGACDNLVGSAPAKLRVRDYAFDRACLAIKTGQALTLTNDGANLHNFSIQNVGSVNVDVKPGATRTTEGLLLDPGEYAFFCKYHRASGMGGELRVKSRSAQRAARSTPAPTAAPRAAPEKVPAPRAQPTPTETPHSGGTHPRKPRSPRPTILPSPTATP